MPKETIEVVLLSDYEVALEVILELGGTDIGAPVITLESKPVEWDNHNGIYVQAWIQRVSDDA